MNSSREILASLAFTKPDEPRTNASVQYRTTEAEQMAQNQPPWESGGPLQEGPRRSNYQRNSAPGSVPNAIIAKASKQIEGLEYGNDGMPVLNTEDKLWQFSERLIASGFLGPHLDTAPKVMNAMAVCHSAGLPWQQFINKTYFINNQIAVYVEFAKAAAAATGKLKRCDVALLNEAGEEKGRHNAKGFKVFAVEATVHNSDLSEPQTFIFSMDDANNAQEIADRESQSKSGKPARRNVNYEKFPGDMLMWRALGRALRLQFAGCTGGALLQGVHDDMMEPLIGTDGRQITTEEGAPVFRRTQDRARAKLNSVFQDEE